MEDLLSIRIDNENTIILVTFVEAVEAGGDVGGE